MGFMFIAVQSYTIAFLTNLLYWRTNILNYNDQPFIVEINGSYSFWRTSGNHILDTMESILNQSCSSGNVGAIVVSANALAQYAHLIGIQLHII